MRELRLGCAETDRIPLGTDETIELVRALKRAVDEKRDLIESGRRKEQVIAELASELAIQRAAASERRALIETMKVQQE